MNASTLKREIELLLSLSGMSAAEFWRAAAAGASAVSSAFEPRFTGGVFVETQGTGTGDAKTSPTTGPVPISRPNLSAGKPVTVQGAGKYFDGQYVVTSVSHNIDSGPYSDGTQFADRRHLVAGHKFTLERHVEADLVRCVVAAAIGSQAAMQAEQVWVKLRPKLRQLSLAARNTLAQELLKATQRGGCRP